MDLADWNTTAALSRDHASLATDTLLVDAVIHTRPWRALQLKGRFRYYEQDSDNRYTAFNPATAEFGYIVEDGGQGALAPRLAGVHIEPIEVGRVAAFLLSDDARIIRGQSINVDGGDTPY